MGPAARDVMEKISTADFSNSEFPFGTAREIEIGMALARAHRISYVGELGWELYIPTEMAAYTFEKIIELDVSLRPKLCGMHVLDSCRLEKAFRHFGHDITDEDNVLEAGLGFAVKIDKAQSKFGEFLGRSAVIRKIDQGLRQRLVQFVLNDPEPLVYHNEPLFRDGKPVGRLTSGNYGHFLGRSVALGYVPIEPGETDDELLGSRYEIEIAGERCAAQASLKPAYDPSGKNMRQ